jgi:hypothetical protein
LSSLHSIASNVMSSVFVLSPLHKV